VQGRAELKAWLRRVGGVDRAAPGNLRGVRPRSVAVAAVAAGLPVLLAAGPAVAGIGDPTSSDGLTAVEFLAIFVLAPLGVILVVAALVGRSRRGPGDDRYRPGRPWPHEEIWFGERPVIGDRRPRVALPGAGGARGDW
jgi:hypothetical protein